MMDKARIADLKKHDSYCATWSVVPGCQCSCGRSYRLECLDEIERLRRIIAAVDRAHCSFGIAAKEGDAALINDSIDIAAEEEKG